MSDAPETKPEAPESKALVNFNPAKGFEFHDLDGMIRAAKWYLDSGFAPESYKRPSQLVICWARGAELGLSPGQALDGLAVINNKITIMGDLALAMVRQSGELADYQKNWTGEDDTLTCHVTLQRKGSQAHTYTYSVLEAKKAGIYARVWPKFPQRMTYYRALGFGLRDEFSDILKGLYIAEELQDMVPLPEPPPPPEPLKFVDVEAQQTNHEGQSMAGQTPLEAQLTREFPQEAQEAAKKQEPLPDAGATTGVSAPAPEPNFDDLDMSPPMPGETEEKIKPFWIDHEIKGVRSFVGRKVGSLTPAEIQLIESKWIPAAHAQIRQATQEQLDDLKAFEARIAHDKMARPW